MPNPWFSRGYYHYPIPERLSPQEIARRRAERLTGLYQRQAEKLRPLLDPQQARRRASLYPDEARLIEQRLRHLQEASREAHKAVEPLQPVRKSRRLLYAAIAGSLLRQRTAASPLSRASFARAQATAAASGMKYNPYAFYKNEELLRQRTNAHSRAIAHALAKFFPMPVNRLIGALPCFDRSTRREVLFARGHGGKGHRVPHKFKPSSGVPC